MHGKYTYHHYTFTFPILLSTNSRVPGGAGGGQDQADQEEEAGGVSTGGDLLHPLTDTSPLDYTRRRLPPPTPPYDTTPTITSSHTTHRHHVIPSSRRTPRLSPAPRRTTSPQSIHTLSLSHPRRGKVTASLLFFLGTTSQPTYQPTYSATYEQARHPVRQRHADGSLPPGVTWRSSEQIRTPCSSAHSCSAAYSRSPAHSSTLEERRVALAQQAHPV